MKIKQNKEAVISAVSENSHVNKKDVEVVIDELFNFIEECAINDEEVNITNFGVFVPKIRKPRKGSHPKDKTEIEIEEKKSISLRLSKTLKRHLNNK